MECSFTGFDPYKLHNVKVTGNELGHGSYATVFELEYGGKKCAGKKIHEILLEQGCDTFAVCHFKEECQLLSRLHHPNIVEFLGVYFEDNKRAPILVMELLNKNLTTYMKEFDNKIIPKETSYSILHGVAEGLCYLHDQAPPVIHRDLSSNNILLTSNLTAKISDLGMARILSMTPLRARRMTQIPGTPAYMPPEVMVADPKYDTSVDTFSYGILMIHIFSGKWPEPQVGPIHIEDGNMIPVSEADRRKVFLQSIGDDHPLMQLILQCIDNDPKKRPHTSAIMEKLTEMVEQCPGSKLNTPETKLKQQEENDKVNDVEGYVDLETLEKEVDLTNGQIMAIPKPQILQKVDNGKKEIPLSQRDGQWNQGPKSIPTLPVAKAKPAVTKPSVIPQSVQMGIGAPPNSIYIANYPYDADDEAEMSFKKGDQMYILSVGNGDWWYAQSVKDEAKLGYIPRNFVTKFKNWETEKWFFGSMNRATAEKQLLTRFNKYGSYLIRKSESVSGTYALSVRGFDGIKHYHIKQQADGSFFLDSGVQFTTISQLIAHYQQPTEGLQLDANLRYPCNVSGKIQTAANIGDGKWRSVQKQNQIKLVKQLSEGQSNEVWGGLWSRGNLPVIVTVLKPETVVPLDFLHIATRAKVLSHVNVIRFYALCAQEEPIRFVTESTRHGELLKHIRCEGRSLKTHQLINMSSQVAAGMAYLEKHDFVQQNLAAKNIMVTDGLVCKVQANFGLSLVISQNEEPFSTKWTAPEAYLYNKFTTKSDVWSFGVVLYEVITYGRAPYPSMNNAQVMKQLREGYRMPKPAGCPDKLYGIMLDCWKQKPEDRPTFETLQMQLRDY